ncbi:hypothetical protein Baya_16722 [Bagarius yarrelli]|uniref:Bcl-2-modifying factor n=1 Tax=Bagarius yarrelli TaxID=175774 RepID=A0A556VWA5_BAGYA|nr:hypothetical protein Baya_16722 [Bagarius yarrelli]
MLQGLALSDDKECVEFSPISCSRFPPMEDDVDETPLQFTSSETDAGHASRDNMSRIQTRLHMQTSSSVHNALVPFPRSLYRAQDVRRLPSATAGSTTDSQAQLHDLIFFPGGDSGFSVSPASEQAGREKEQDEGKWREREEDRQHVEMQIRRRLRVEMQIGQRLRMIGDHFQRERMQRVSDWRQMINLKKNLSLHSVRRSCRINVPILRVRPLFTSQSNPNY